MNAKYHERFKAALAERLPGFDIYADAHITTASFAGARLVMGTPAPDDKRKPVEPADVSEWIERATSRLHYDMNLYKPEHVAKGRALLDAIQETQP